MSMQIYLAGLNQTHFKSALGYAEAAQEVGNALVSFFDYSGCDGKLRVCNSLLPETNLKEDHEREINDES